MFRQILVAFLFSGIAVSFVVLFTQSFRMLSFVIDNSSSIVVFLQLMGLMIPSFLPLIIPISIGVAVLFIYHKMAVESELVVMRAAGISPMKLATPAIVMAGMAVLIGLVLTLWVTPASNAALVSLQYKVRDEFSAFMIQPGTFNDLDDGLTLFARKRTSQGGLQDILVHDVRNPQKPVTIMAKSGLLSVENDQPQIVVFQGKRQEIDVATGHLQQLNFDRYSLDLHLLKNNKLGRIPDPREMGIGRLVSAQSDDTLSNKARTRVIAELHQRLAGPFLALTFTLMGVTVILVGDFNRRGMTKRVFLAALAIVIVQASTFGLVSQVGSGPWIVLLLYLVILTPIVPCFYMLSSKTIRRLPLFLFQPKGAGS